MLELSRRSTAAAEAANHVAEAANAVAKGSRFVAWVALAVAAVGAVAAGVQAWYTANPPGSVPTAAVPAVRK